MSDRIWRVVLLASTALLAIAPAAWAGGVRDAVPTRIAVLAAPRVTPVVVHDLVVSPLTLFVQGSSMTCLGAFAGPGIFFSTPGGFYTARPAFPASAATATPWRE